MQQSAHERAATGEHDALARALQQVVAESAEEAGEHDEADEQGHEAAELAALLDRRDDLGDEEGLREGGARTEHADDDDPGEHRAVLEQVGHELAEARAWAVVDGPSEKAASGGRGGRGCARAHAMILPDSGHERAVRQCQPPGSRL